MTVLSFRPVSRQCKIVLTDRISGACDIVGFTISTEKTKVVYQPYPGKPHQKPNISVKGEVVNNVDKFTYLGSTLSCQANIDEEVKCSIAKISSAFGRRQTIVWERRGIRLSSKLKVYQVVIINTLLYACEVWTVFSKHPRQLNHFHTTCLCKPMKIKWQERIPDTEVFSCANMPSIHTLLERAQAR